MYLILSAPAHRALKLSQTSIQPILIEPLIKLGTVLGMVDGETNKTKFLASGRLPTHQTPHGRIVPPHPIEFQL